MQIKYMGRADVRRLEKGENFGGRLNETLSLNREIEWNWENNHIINTDDFVGVDEEFWTLLLEDPDWKNVTDLKRIPTNEAQQTWRAMPKSEDADDRNVSVASSGTGASTTADAGDASADAGDASADAGAESSSGASTPKARRA